MLHSVCVIQWKGMRFFSVLMNRLTGSIPDLSQYPKLELATFNSNQLTGLLPALPPSTTSFEASNN